MFELGLLVTGSRDFKDYDFVHGLFSLLHEKYKPEDIVLFEGGQRSKKFNPDTGTFDYWGLDYLAKLGAKNNNWGRIKSFPAKWKLHGRKAGILRNIEMIDAFYMDDKIKTKLVWAFPLPNSVGTIHARDYAACQKLTVEQINYPKVDRVKILPPN